MARFLVDESLPPQLALALRADGHDAVHVYDLQLSSADDDTIYRAAADAGLILLSQDLDFSDVRRFQSNVVLVVVRFRHQLTRDETVRLCVSGIRRAITEFEALEGGVMILEAGRGRIRRKSP